MSDRDASHQPVPGGSADGAPRWIFRAVLRLPFLHDWLLRHSNLDAELLVLAKVSPRKAVREAAVNKLMGESTLLQLALDADAPDDVRTRAASRATAPVSLQAIALSTTTGDSAVDAARRITDPEVRRQVAFRSTNLRVIEELVPKVEDPETLRDLVLRSKGALHEPFAVCEAAELAVRRLERRDLLKEIVSSSESQNMRLLAARKLRVVTDELAPAEELLVGLPDLGEVPSTWWRSDNHYYLMDSLDAAILVLREGFHNWQLTERRLECSGNVLPRMISWPWIERRGDRYLAWVGDVGRFYEWITGRSAARGPWKRVSGVTEIAPERRR